MKKSRLLGAVCACLSILSFNASALVLNTLNGVDYQWLELTETAGLSRDAVELRLLDVNDVLYGYEYASRQQVEDLLWSYSSWDGLEGWHGAPNVVQGLASFLTDFGVMRVDPGTGVNGNLDTVDGYEVLFDGRELTSGYYGADDECSDDTGFTCYTTIQVYSNVAGVPTMAEQIVVAGWDADYEPMQRLISKSYAGPGSFLVQVNPVPVPAAVWLFGSGLLGLIGIARRKQA